MATYGKAVGSIRTQLSEEDKLTTFWRTTITEPMAVSLANFVDKEFFTDISADVNAIIAKYIRKTKEMKNPQPVPPASSVPASTITQPLPSIVPSMSLSMAPSPVHPARMPSPFGGDWAGYLMPYQYQQSLSGMGPPSRASTPQQDRTLETPPPPTTTTS